MSLRERLQGTGRTVSLIARLPRREAAVLAHAWGLLLAYRLLGCLPAPLGGPVALLRRAARAASGDSTSREDPGPGRAARIAELVDLAARNHATRPSCLPRALVLWRVLRAEGVPARLRLGLRGAGRAFTGHAWVEHHGGVIGEPGEHVRGFVPLRFSPPRAQETR